MAMASNVSIRQDDARQPFTDLSARSRNLGLMKVQPRALPAFNDDELLAEISRGNAEAFRCLTERHIDRAYAIAHRILGNSADAEDVVQDCFLKVWTSSTRWEPGRASFSTWLYRVVTNRCIDIKRRPTGEDIAEVPDMPCGAPDQVNMLMRAEASDQIVAAMAALPAQQRLALLFSYFENLSNSEIAKLMQTSVMAVESLLKRGRQQLRLSLRNEAGDLISSFKNR